MIPNTPPTIPTSRAVTLLIFTLARRWIHTNGNRLVMRQSVACVPTELEWRLAAPEVGPAFFILATRGLGAGAGLKRVTATNFVTSTRRSYVPVGEAGVGMEAPTRIEMCALVQTKRWMKGQRGR